MKKLFISCPMRGRSNESILASIEQWLEIDRRKKNGERLSDILDEMKVLD